MGLEEQQLPKLNRQDIQLTSKWKCPEKFIFSEADLNQFKKSMAINRINATISLICTKISLHNIPQGTINEDLVKFDSLNKKHGEILPPPSFEEAKNTSKENYSNITMTILKILLRLEQLVEDTPPFPGPRRYGNLACRDWHDKVKRDLDDILDNSLNEIFNCYEKNPKLLVQENYDGFKKEVKFYLLGAFGSRERLDYGTGHELSFIAFLGCLVMIELIDRENMKGIEWLVILSKYYDLVKLLILTYTLEPAGSHGVWGLDDHFHLIYIFGSCQLVDFAQLGKDEQVTGSNKDLVMNFRMGLTPSSILNVETLERERTKNLYYNAISFIRKVKKGPFNEHSPILYEVSASKNWEKVAKGMLRMYYGEVLSKFPVIQHFYFGGVFYPWKDEKGVPIISSNREVKEDFVDLKLPKKPIALVDTTTRANRRYESEVMETMNTNHLQRGEQLAKLLNGRRISSQRTRGTDR